MPRSGHFAADHYAAVSVQHGAIDDGVVLGGPTDTAAILVAPGLDGDAIVAHGDVTVRDVNVAAGIRIDTVGVWPFLRIFDRNGVNRHVVAIQWRYRPERRIDYRDTFNEHVRAVVRLDERRA